MPSVKKGFKMPITKLIVKFFIWTFYCEYYTIITVKQSFVLPFLEAEKNHVILTI